MSFDQTKLGLSEKREEEPWQRYMAFGIVLRAQELGLAFACIHGQPVTRSHRAACSRTESGAARLRQKGPRAPGQQDPGVASREP